MKQNASAWYAKPLSALSLGLALTLTGCASQTKPSVAYQPPAPPADLAAPCPDLPLITDGQAVTVAAWIVDAAGAYKDCQAKQAGLVRAWPGVSFSHFAR